MDTARTMIDKGPAPVTVDDRFVEILATMPRLVDTLDKLDALFVD